MGALIAYTVKAGLMLLVGYFAYKLLLANENQPGFNRFVLLAIYCLSLVLPLFDWPAIGAAVPGNISIGRLESSISAVGDLGSASFGWIVLAVWIYAVGAIVAVVASLLAFARLWAVLLGAERISAGPYTLALVKNKALAPFSWLKYIAMTRDDIESCGSLVIAHESAHLRSLHWVDLLVAQIVCIVFWYNPASWLMRDELRCVHEYQADEKVLASGIEARQYQILLIKKAVGRKMPSLANSLNHSKLKNRITMMCNSKTSKLRRLRALAVVPALGAALSVVNIPAVASTVSALGNSPATVSTGKSSEKSVVAQAEPAAQNSGVVPSFPGGEAQLYKFIADNIHYPAEAVKSGAQGRVVVQFEVESDGSLGNFTVIQSVSPELDAEAIATIKKMPKWIPATIDGKAVKSTMSIPITFKSK